MMIRSFLPVGQGAFYCEQFAVGSRRRVNVIYDCGSATVEQCKNCKKVNADTTRDCAWRKPSFPIEGTDVEKLILGCNDLRNSCIDCSRR